MQARWIIEKSNWVGPLFWDQVSSDRTIGIQFLMAIAKKLLGDALFVIYIPIFLAAILMLYCTFQLHKELLEDKNPIYSAFILSTTFYGLIMLIWHSRYSIFFTHFFRNNIFYKILQNK